jgi:creatinine amidohydrolase
MPFGMDSPHAEAIARRVAESVGGVVMPTLFWGAEREVSPEMLRNIGFEEDKWIIGMDYPANSMKSMYSQEDIFGLVVRARLDLIVRQDYRLVVIVNGHGARNHLATLDRLATEFTAQSPARVVLITAFKPDLEGGGYSGIGHADAVETSIMMALHPDAVDLTTLPALPEPMRNVDWGVGDGPTFAGNPSADRTLDEASDPRRTASAERGEHIMTETAAWIGEQVQAALHELEAQR